MDGFSCQVFAKVPVEVIRNAIEENPEDACLAVTSLLWTDAPDIREHARSLSEHDPIATAGLLIMAREPEMRLKLAQRLMEQSPANSLGYLAGADALARMGDVAGSEELLSKFGDDVCAEFHFAGIAEAQMRLLKAGGYTPVQIGLLYSHDAWRQKALEFTGGMIARGLNSSDDVSRARFASLAMNMIDQMREEVAPAISFAASNQLSTLEELTLRRLPEDYLMAGGGESIESRIEELAGLTAKRAERGAMVSELLNRSGPSIVKEYYSMLVKQGEEASARWLLGEVTSMPAEGNVIRDGPR